MEPEAKGQGENRGKEADPERSTKEQQQEQGEQKEQDADMSEEARGAYLGCKWDFHCWEQ